MQKESDIAVATADWVIDIRMDQEMRDKTTNLFQQSPQYTFVLILNFFCCFPSLTEVNYIGVSKKLQVARTKKYNFGNSWSNCNFKYLQLSDDGS